MWTECGIQYGSCSGVEHVCVNFNPLRSNTVLYVFYVPQQKIAAHMHTELELV